MNTKSLFLILFLFPVAWAQKGGDGEVPPVEIQCPYESRSVTSIYRAGEPDDFREPFEEPYIGPNLRGLSEGWLMFDEKRPGMSFGHTFLDLPCTIGAATLTITLQACGEQSIDDWIGLEVDTNGRFIWSSAIRDLDPKWGPPGQTVQITLDLAALPSGKGTFNLLPWLNADRALDVFLTDFVAVDSMELQVTWCDIIDCNNNCVHDYDDINNGTSLDTNGNMIPDECEEIEPEPDLEIFCERFVTVGSGDNCCGFVMLTPVAIGGSEPITITNDYDSQQIDGLAACFPIGIHEVWFTATDKNGKTARCKVTVHVYDNTPPVITAR